jgi:exopolyphosphatase/guanosine-5'-triphosphate,3'-diphosphate pyrophosphatase
MKRMNFSHDLTPEQQNHLECVLELVKTFDYEEAHTQHVTFLALRLFDELQDLHKLGPDQRFQLLCAGLLHDIGWAEGWKDHHKTALRTILETPLLQFDSKERLIIGSVARYHRKALPDLKHDHYAALDPPEREVVNILAALLRLADGLDRSHRRLVKDLTAKASHKKVIIRCASEVPVNEEAGTAEDKSDLMKIVFKRKVVLHWESTL